MSYGWLYWLFDVIVFLLLVSQVLHLLGAIRSKGIERQVHIAEGQSSLYYYCLVLLWFSVSMGVCFPSVWALHTYDDWIMAHGDIRVGVVFGVITLIIVQGWTGLIIFLSYKRVARWVRSDLEPEVQIAWNKKIQTYKERSRKGLIALFRDWQQAKMIRRKCKQSRHNNPLGH